VEDVSNGPSIYYPVNCLEYCPRKDDLQYLVTGGSEGAIYYFDLVNLRNCKTLKRESSVTHVKFSPDGSYFAYATGNDYNKGATKQKEQKKVIVVEKV